MTLEDMDFTPHPKVAPQPRQKAMEVLCLGLSRTGTMSTYIALNKLGFNCYHAVEQGRDNANQSIKQWKEAIEAKYYGKDHGKLETAEDFDRLLWRYQAVTDIPCVLFADELIQSYPNAKIILTTRPEEGWIRSVQHSFYAVLNMRAWRVLQYIDYEHAYHYIPLLHYCLQIWSDGDESNTEKLRQGYRKHNAHIRTIAPKDRFLEYHPSQGWEPLCRFLEVPVPAEPMPRVNEGTFAADLHKYLAIRRLQVVVAAWAKRAVPLFVAGMGWYAYRQYGSYFNPRVSS